MVVINERQLGRLLRDYVDYYNQERVHTVLGDAPEGRLPCSKPSISSGLVALPRVGGLHHRYEWREGA